MQRSNWQHRPCDFSPCAAGTKGSARYYTLIFPQLLLSFVFGRLHWYCMAKSTVSKTRNIRNILKIKKWHGDVYIRPVMHQNTPTKRAQNSQEAGIVSMRTHPLFNLPMAKFTVSKTRNIRNILKIKKMAWRCEYSARNSSKYANKTRTKFSGGRHSEYKNTALIQPPNGGKKLF